MHLNFNETSLHSNFHFLFSSTDQKNSNLDSRSMHFKPSLKFHEGVIIDKKVTNCDLPYLCPPNSFPLSLNTGQDNQKYPELCIDGKMYVRSSLPIQLYDSLATLLYFAS